jgi:hypothetical protein
MWFMDVVGFSARRVAQVGVDPFKKVESPRGIALSPGNTWASTKAGSGPLPGSDEVSGISISAPSLREDPPSVRARVLVHQDVQAVKSLPTFAQRHPLLARVFRVFTAVLAFPLLLALNTVAIPLAHAVACASKEWGDGGLAQSMGKSRLVRALWGDGFADWLATGDGKVQGVLAMLCVCLPVLLVKSAVFSVHGASGLFDNLSNGFSERAWACQAGSIYDTWTKDQGVLAPSYRFRSGTWVRAR